MGAYGSMFRLRQAGLVRGDLVYRNEAGYERLGDLPANAHGTVPGVLSQSLPQLCDSGQCPFQKRPPVLIWYLQLLLFYLF